MFSLVILKIGPLTQKSAFIIFESSWFDHPRPEWSSKWSENLTWIFLLENSWLFSAPFIYVTSCNLLGFLLWPQNLACWFLFRNGNHGQRNLVGYKSMGSQRVRHNRVTEHTHSHGFCSLYSIIFFLTTSPILDWEESYPPHLSSFSLSRRYIFNVQNILFGLYT